MSLAPQHLLSLSRLGLGAVVLTRLVSSPQSFVVLPAVALACAADFADGVVARRRHAGSTAGRLLDNLCDATFLALVFWGFAQAHTWSAPQVGSAACAWRHANWLPLVGLACSFGTYLLRWLVAARYGAAPRRSRAGHLAGIANYALALVGGAAVFPGLAVTPWLLEALFVAVTLLNLGAAVENLGLLARRSDAPWA